MTSISLCTLEGSADVEFRESLQALHSYIKGRLVDFIVGVTQQRIRMIAELDPESAGRSIPPICLFLQDQHMVGWRETDSTHRIMSNSLRFHTCDVG